MRNSGGASCPACTLQEAITKSLNTTFYGLAYEVGPQNVARRSCPQATGLPETLGRRQPQGQHDAGQPADRRHRLGDLGIGQYEMRPIDQAVGFATFAAGGVHRDPYFVAKVTDSEGNQLLGPPADQGEQVIPADVANDVTVAIKGVAQYSKRPLEGGREVASKTGTVGSTDQDNSDAWMVGYTPSISTAVWMGTDQTTPIMNAAGKIIYGSGLPGAIWQKFMNAVLEGDAEGEAARQGAHPGRHRRGRARADHGGARRSPRAADDPGVVTPTETQATDRRHADDVHRTATGTAAHLAQRRACRACPTGQGGPGNGQRQPGATTARLNRHGTLNE